MEKDIRYTKFGWVNLSNLVKRKQSYDWDASVGKTVDFEYQGIRTALTIKEKVSKQYVKIDVDGFVKDKIIYVGQIKHNRLGECVGVITHRYKYNIGDVVGNLKLIDMFRKSNDTSHKYYRCKCLVDGYEWDLREDHLKNGHGCPVCTNKTTIKGVNDIATTNPEFVKHFVNIEDAYSHTMCSNKKVKLKCPECGYEKMYTLNKFTGSGFSCPQCGDKTSYANKYIFNFLRQLLNVEYIKPEHKFDWSECVPTAFKPEGKTMIYDEYIPMFNMIIENHGDQHYNDRGFGEKQPAWMIKENDRAKKQAAIDNGIYYYIELDCRKSESDYIKNSIMSSELPNIFDFSEEDICWDECDKYASGSLLIHAMALWNNGLYDLKEIALSLGIHPETVRKYIKRANSLNLLTTPYPLHKQSKSTSHAS